MNNQIPETPNTANETTYTVAQAVHALGLSLDIGTLGKLGKECSTVARSWGRPTGVVPVYGKRWPSEKSYTADVVQEVFRLNPATRDALAAIRAAQQTAALAADRV